MGFRGEALPSIASISRFSMVTRTAGDEAATHIRVDGGTLAEVRRTGAPVGTEIDVRALFFNVPARRKFLRTPETELSHAVETVARIALMRPDVDLTLRHGDRVLIRAPIADLARRASDVLGPDARHLLPIDLRDGGDLRLHGLASPPGEGRGSASESLYLYVNGRWVKDVVLRRAVYQAYRDLVPKGRYPLVVVDLTIPRDEVDVNVHPTKAEVRFINPRDLTSWIATGLRDLILGASVDPRHRPARGGYTADVPTLPLGGKAWAPSIPAHPDDAPMVVREPSAAAFSVEPPPAPTARVEPVLLRDEPMSAPPRVEAPRPPPPLATSPRLRQKVVVGVAKRRWVILEDDDGVVALDAARAAMALSLREGGSARRLVPARVLLAPADVETLTDADATLHASGLDLARFGPREFAVKAVPPALVDADPAEVLRVAADALRAGQSLVVAWSQRLPPPPLEEALDDVGVRTLLATIEEVGLAIESVRLPLRM